MWKITNDYIDEGRSIGVCSMDYEETRLLPHRFRLLDGDGIIYYEGLADDEDSFDPLDDFGIGYAGAASIAYFRNGAFMTL